jgi:hypothetical protein
MLAADIASPDVDVEGEMKVKSPNLFSGEYGKEPARSACKDVMIVSD